MASVYLSLVNLFTRNSRFINGTIADAYQNMNWFDTHLPERTKLDYTIFQSDAGQFLQAGIKAYRVPLHKTVCIYNGIDLNRFRDLTPPPTNGNAIIGANKRK